MAPAPPQPELKYPTKQPSRRQSLVSSVSEAPSTSWNGRGRVPSVQLNGNPRPDTAQSIRPESSMSVRGTNGGVRKTLSMAQGRPDVSKPSRTRKPQLSDSLGSIPNVDGASEVATAPVAPSAPYAQPRNDDTALDNITSGLGKIKLTLLTKAQREARDQAKEDSKLAKAPRKPVVPKAARSSSAKPKPKLDQNDISHKAQPTTVIKQEEQLPSIIDDSQLPPFPVLPTQESMRPFAALDAPLPPLPPSSPSRDTLTPRKYDSSEAQGSVSGNDSVFIPYQPEGPALEPTQQQDNLTWLPPNTDTPVAIKTMKRYELPVFTSTSPIRFGVPSEQGTNGGGSNGARNDGSLKQNAEKQDESIWEVPETPEK